MRPSKFGSEPQMIKRVVVGERGRKLCQWYISSSTFIQHKSCALFIHPWKCPYKGYSKEGECPEFKQREKQSAKGC